jgi:SAM-dependent methyltransferase
MSSGITWFFENVEQGIILEDDCLPNKDFFRFCKPMLLRHKQNNDIGMISGDNFLNHKVRSVPPNAPYLSRYVHIWGWASWRRAWIGYDPQIKDWPEAKQKGLLAKILKNTVEVKYWTTFLDNVYSGKINTWDAQLQFHIWHKGQMALVPPVNLISNIGFQTEATHTLNPNNSCASMRRERLSIQLEDSLPVPCESADDYEAYYVFHSRDKQVLGPLYTRHCHHPFQAVRTLFRKLSQWSFVTRKPEKKRSIAEFDSIEITHCWCGGCLQEYQLYPDFGICLACGSLIRKRQLSAQSVKEYYSHRNYWGQPAEMEKRARLYRKDGGRLESWLQIISDYTIRNGITVEIGCAPGCLLEALREKNWQVFGVEPAPDITNWLVKTKKLDVRAGIFPYEQLHLPQCDLFIALDVLEHVSQPLDFLIAARDLLLPGGLIFLQTPVELRDDNKPFSKCSYLFEEIDHRCMFSEKAIRILAERAGLNILELCDGWAMGHEYILLKKIAIHLSDLL